VRVFQDEVFELEVAVGHALQVHVGHHVQELAHHHLEGVRTERGNKGV
jgi:hypothetical protein